MEQQRIAALIDMDCFYVQCHLQNEPQYKGLPSVVVQYEKSRDQLYEGQFDPTVKRGGESIIAVSYEARALGIKRREHRLRDALKLCSSLHVFQIEEKYGKACLALYREASKKVVNIMKRYCPTLERSSIDECYLNLSTLAPTYSLPTQPNEIPNCWLSGCKSVEESFQLMLQKSCSFTRAAKLVSDIRSAILDELGFTCSAGISVNKMSAKFIAGLKKPNSQSVLLPSQVDEYFKSVPIRKLRGLGGKLGAELCTNFGVDKCGEVAQISDKELFRIFGEGDGKFIRDMSLGRDNEPIKTRYYAESCGSGRNFFGVDKVIKRVQVDSWIKSLFQDLFDRLKEYKEEYQVTPRKLTIHISWHGTQSKARVPLQLKSKSIDFVYNMETMISRATKVVLSFNQSGNADIIEPAIEHLTFSASQMVKENENRLTDYFFAQKDRGRKCSKRVSDDHAELQNANVKRQAVDHSTIDSDSRNLIDCVDIEEKSSSTLEETAEPNVAHEDENEDIMALTDNFPHCSMDGENADILKYCSERGDVSEDISLVAASSSTEQGKVYPVLEPFDFEIVEGKTPDEKYKLYCMLRQIPCDICLVNVSLSEYKSHYQEHLTAFGIESKF